MRLLLRMMIFPSRLSATLLQILLFLWIAPSGIAGELQLEFILDASSSMKEEAQGDYTRFDFAKNALKRAISVLPANLSIAVRVYGHRLDQSNKSESCKDTELLGRVKRAEWEKYQALLGRIDALKSRGYTSISHTLSRAREDFAKDKDVKRSIILLSDGDETCGGDPEEVIKELRAEGFEVSIHTIAFMVDTSAKKRLSRIAKLSGGSFVSVKEATELATALTDTVFSAISKADPRFSLPTLGDLGTRFDAGATAQEAMEIRSGEYSDNHLGGGDGEDLFKFIVEQGEKIKISVMPSTDTDLNLKVQAQDGSEYFSEQGLRGAEIVSGVIEVAESGFLNIVVKDVEKQRSPFSYSIKLDQLVALD